MLSSRHFFRCARLEPHRRYAEKNEHLYRISSRTCGFLSPGWYGPIWTVQKIYKVFGVLIEMYGRRPTKGATGNGINNRAFQNWMQGTLINFLFQQTLISGNSTAARCEAMTMGYPNFQTALIRPAEQGYPIRNQRAKPHRDQRGNSSLINSCSQPTDSDISLSITYR